MSELNPTVVSVDLGDRGYEIVISTGMLARCADTILPWGERSGGWAKSGQKAAIVTDENVERHAAVVRESLAAAGWQTQTIVIAPGEASKSLDVISGMYDQMVSLQADRRTLVVAVGGGVVGDAAGFLAATYTRGLPFVQVPTTLLADVDSSVGGKVGINHSRAKNLIGAFHQPIGVCIDTDALKTLPKREYRSGLAEVIKYGVILDDEFFTYLEDHVEGLNDRTDAVLQHAIARSCRLKADVVEQDEHERTGLRAKLNYGHTFAHAYEALSGYGELLHGEAVAIGMVHASRMAERLGMIDETVTERQIALLQKVGLPTSLPEDARWPADAIIERMRLDKKTLAGRLRFILPTRIGNVQFADDATNEDITAILSQFA